MDKREIGGGKGRGVTGENKRDKQSNALIINLWLSRGVETCASGKGIEAENNMKR